MGKHPSPPTGKLKPLGPLPPPDAPMVILSDLLEGLRDLMGQQICHDHLVGGMRRKKIGFAMLTVPVNGRDEPDNDPAEIARNVARVVLTNLCARCKHVKCPLNGK